MLRTCEGKQCKVQAAVGAVSQSARTFFGAVAAALRLTNPAFLPLATCSPYVLFARRSRTPTASYSGTWPPTGELARSACLFLHALFARRSRTPTKSYSGTWPPTGELAFMVFPARLVRAAGLSSHEKRFPVRDQACLCSTKDKQS